MQTSLRQLQSSGAATRPSAARGPQTPHRSLVQHAPQTTRGRAGCVVVQASGGGFGPKKTPTKVADKGPKEKKPQPAGQAPPAVGLRGTATPDQLDSGLWNDVVPDVQAFFDNAGKDVKAVTLAAGRSLVMYRHNGVVLCSDCNSTAYQFPLVDAKIIEREQGPAVEVPLEGTVYDLRTGKVLDWCPNSENMVRNLLATLKRNTTPTDLPVFPTHVTATGKLRVRLTAK